MSDFLKYWDTRIDANERFFNKYPHIANFAFSECQELWDHMESENKALLARHNALAEAAAWERECECVRNKNRMFRNWPETVESERSYDAARAEVDRLIANNESADCKGE